MDPKLPAILEARIDKLLSRKAMAGKIGQMRLVNADVTDLNQGIKNGHYVYDQQGHAAPANVPFYVDE